ncbi:hypothetical protein [Ligilactobacillus murinus]|uniref:Uncharacterized protein n=1 Tax=Ligilactobacillus murinus TaxID=1622 RepID=A0AAE6WJF9_9LACO|nr:hypothetical protein [Ligilactobacillus murinus]NEF82737.1 hypothetical protein [Ligilactobacillus murinus]NEF84315.1 hypothetical protein [Ligilactobacillus murinus]NEF87309.1 hypothetical protein [Ligilactobacillus murinus]NEF89643.1 hypothetical protein [Ligilactobacillus murinus]NEF91895.1 hypothetical protein [Ligilactobacillus murinus]
MQNMGQEKLNVGIYLKDTSKDIQNSLNDLGAIEYDQGYIFPFKDEELSTYEELGEGVGYIVLGGINEITADFYPSDELTKLFADDQEVKATELDVSFIPDISDFIDENSDEVATILQKIATKHGVGMSEEEKNADVPASEGDFVNSNATPGSTHLQQSKSGDEPTNEEDFVNSDVEPKTVDLQHPGQYSAPPKDDRKQNDNPELSQSITGKVDPLLTLAADIFENNVEATLPIFDEYTSTQLRPHIVKSEITVHNARDKTILAIYDIIKEHRDALEKEFEKNFSKYTDEHDSTIKVLKSNEKIDIEKITAKSQKEYKEAQDKFVIAQEQVLRDKYDSKHKQDHLHVLQLKIDNVKKQTEKDVEVENKQYEKALLTEKINYLERRFRQLDYTDTINNFNKIVAEENQTLLTASKDFKDQVGAMVADLVAERDQLKKELDAEKRSREVLKNTMSKQIDVEVGRQAEQLTINYKKERDDALNNANEQNSMNQQTISSLNDSLDSERDKNRILTQQIQAMTELSPVATHKTDKEIKSGVFGTILGALLIIISIIGLLFGGYTFMHNSLSLNESSVQQSSQTSHTSTKSYSSGDKWLYKASDGKTYEVTMDSPTTGTYKDDDGNTHKVELN